MNRYQLSIRVLVCAILIGTGMLSFQQRSDALDLKIELDRLFKEGLCRLLNSTTEQCLPKQDNSLPPTIEPIITDPSIPQLPTPESLLNTPPATQQPPTSPLFFGLPRSR